MAHKKNESSIFVIGEDFTICTIDTIKQKVDKKIVENKDFNFDLSNVEEVDSAGVQLLLAVKKECICNKKSFKIIKLSHAMENIIDCFGLKAVLNLGDIL